MQMHTRKVIVVITEALLEKPLTEDIKKLGVRGYTVTSARGEGSRGKRSADLDGAQNIRLEIICDEPLADKITAHLADRYMPNYAMVLYTLDAQVLRPQKF
ncbi:MAG: Membrane-associated protein [Candidatus Omnitrophica bacterium]|nr:Membrane-associated protein [Candidatus Omnitrophota bacterium]